MRHSNQASQDFYNRKFANKYKDYNVAADTTLLQFLLDVVTGGNRTRAKQLLTQQMVYVDKVITTHYNTPLRSGQLVQIASRGNLHSLRSKWISVVYEDAFLIVVDKAPGILSNAPIDSKEQSVKRLLDEYLGRGKRPVTSHIVHRLDRYTSGLMIFAKRRDVQEMFIDSWRDIVTDRRYQAVCEGQLPDNAGTVQSWLYDDKRFMTHSSPMETPNSKFAVTHYHTLRRTADRTLVEYKLETGRKNQIRVHMQDLGHPIVGDLKYGAKTDPIGRVCLHACSIDFRHPITGEFLNFTSPLPEEIKSLV